jgi:hypothetical protein
MIVETERFLRAKLSSDGVTVIMFFPLQEGSAQEIADIFINNTDLDIQYLIPVFINKIDSFSYKIEGNVFFKYLFELIILVGNYTIKKVGQEKYLNICKS